MHTPARLRPAATRSSRGRTGWRTGPASTAWPSCRSGEGMGGGDVGEGGGGGEGSWLSGAGAADSPLSARHTRVHQGLGATCHTHPTCRRLPPHPHWLVGTRAPTPRIGPPLTPHPSHPPSAPLQRHHRGRLQGLQRLAVGPGWVPGERVRVFGLSMSGRGGAFTRPI